MLSQLTVLLYLIMYMLMFTAAIALRYRMPKADRPFAIGRKGNGLIWIVAGIGFLGALLAFVLSFIPPSQINTGSHTVWFTVLVLGCVIFVAIPLIIYAMRKPSWKDPNTVIQPFHWEVNAATTTRTAPKTSTATPRTSITPGVSPALGTVSSTDPQTGTSRTGDASGTKASPASAQSTAPQNNIPPTLGKKKDKPSEK